MFLILGLKHIFDSSFWKKVLFRQCVLLEMYFAEMSLLTHLPLWIEDGHGYNLIRSDFSES